jgi:molybdate transport system permease protein
MRYVLILLTIIYLLAILGPMVAIVLQIQPDSLKDAHRYDTIVQALTLTLKTSLVVTFAALILGLPIALCMARVEFRGRALLDMLVDVPIALPPVVTGFGLMLLWGRRGLLGHYFDAWGYHIPFTTLACMISQFVVASPYFVRIAQSGLSAVPKDLEDVARSLGASPLRVWLTVTLPMASTAILAGLVTCWARAIGEFGATVIFAGNFPGRTQTMPLAVFLTLQYDIPGAVLLATVMIVFALVGFAVAQMLLRRFNRPHMQITAGERAI